MQTPEEVSDYQRQYRARNKERIKGLIAKWKERNPGYYPKYLKRYYAENSDYYKRMAKKRYVEKKDLILAQLAARVKRRRDLDPIFRNLLKVRNGHYRCWSVGYSERSAWRQRIGCTWKEYRAHIESTWVPGMNWENYGAGIGKWCIDHIVPVSQDALLTEEGIRRTFNFKNTRALWWIDNLTRKP